MRLFTKSTWIAVCLLSGIFLLSCKDTKDRFYPIPENSDAIAVVDLSSLSKKLVMDKLSDFSISDLFDFSEEDTSTQKNDLSTILNDPTGAGIDVLENMYLFKIDQTVGAVVRLDDEDDFTDHIKNNLHKDPKSLKEYKYIFLDSFLLSWNKDHCIFLLREDGAPIPLSDLEKLLTITKEESIFSNAAFQKRIEVESDVLVWFSIPKLLRNTPASTQISEGLFADTYSSAYIHFEEGKIRFQVEDFLSPSLSQLLSNSSHEKNNLSYIKSPAYLALGALKLNMTEVIKFIKPYSNSTHFEKIGVGEQDLAGTFSGEFLVNVSELREYQKTYSSYSFDDDFNKVETVDTIKGFHPIFSVFIGSQNSDKTKKILDSLVSKNLLDKKEENYRFMLSDIPVNFFNLTHGVLITNQNKKFGLAENPESEVASEIAQNPLIVQGNPYKFFPLLKPNYREAIPLDQIDTAFLKLSKNAQGVCILNGEIQFKNTEKNSLLTLVKILKERDKKTLYY